MDLAFIVQNSMSESGFNGVKSFMKGVMDALQVGRTNTYIGVITFNENAKIELEFSSSDGTWCYRPCLSMMIDWLYITHVCLRI